VNAPGATLRFQPGGLQGNGDLQISGLGTKFLTGTNPFSGRLVTGTGGRLELIDTGGGASIAANGYSVYNTTFRVGPGATLVKAAGAPQLPYIAVDGAGRVEIEQSQNLSGLTVGLSTSGPTDNPTLIASPGVVLNLTFGLQGSYGTVDAALVGSVTSGSFLYKQANTVPGNTGTLTVSGQSTFTGRVFIESGVLSVNSLGMTGQPSALGAGGNIELFRYQNTSSTLRYTGPSATTDRLLQVDGIDAINAPSIIEVTNPAATLTWAGPVTYSTNTSVPRLQKGGVGTLAIASTGNTFYVPGTGGGNGKIGVLAGTLSVTGSVEAQVAVESGATASGKLVGANATNYRVVVGGGAVALTARAGGTVRAGTGGGTDVLGVDGVQFDAGSKFAVTVDGGASPTASRIQNSAAGNAINFSPVASTGKITLQLEKGAGAEFIPFQPVTVEVARTPGLIRRSNSAFAYNPDEWALVTVGFDIVPGSFSLLTTEGGSVLNARFTPVPEPAVPLAVGTAAAVLARRRLRWNRPTAAVTG
jgi:fibronectin-binding autotransporter adhesin